MTKRIIKQNPFAALAAARRSISPRKLRGEKLKLWAQLIKRIAAGEYDGIGLEELHE